MRVERLTSWPAATVPGRYVARCSCGCWACVATAAALEREAGRHDDAPWHHHVVAIRGRVLEA